MTLQEAYLEWVLNRPTPKRQLESYLLDKQWEQEPVEPGNRLKS